MGWQEVEEALPNAKSIAWDECHKIYVLMDDEQTRTMEGYGYDPLLPVTNPATALSTLHDWWDASCGLRFISAVKTVSGDPNEGFTSLISQFENDEDDEFNEYDDDEDNEDDD
jgi:hypothetical protein